MTDSMLHWYVLQSLSLSLSLSLSHTRTHIELKCHLITGHPSQDRALLPQRPLCLTQICGGKWKHSSSNPQPAGRIEERILLAFPP